MFVVRVKLFPVIATVLCVPRPLMPPPAPLLASVAATSVKLMLPCVRYWLPIKAKLLAPEYEILVVPIVMASAPTARLLPARAYQLALPPSTVGTPVVAGTSLHPTP